MRNHKRMKGLLAASLYEELPEPDQRALDAHLASCESCREEAEAFARMVARVPKSSPELRQDLLPRLRTRIRSGERQSRRLAWRWGTTPALAAAGVLFAAVVAFLVFAPRANQDVAPIQTAKSPVLSPAAVAMDRAAALLKSHDYTGAYSVLKEAVESYPEDRCAGDAQTMLADVAFTHLNWYEQADKAYGRLRTAYPEVFMSSPESIRRLDLLAEARQVDYASLYGLDAAGDNFDKLEEVVARYPATFVASLAARRMGGLLMDESGRADGGALVQALERAREQCTDPIAVAQLKVEAAHLYRHELGDSQAARDLYEQVAEGGHVLLAQLARSSLKGLEGAPAD